MKSISFQLFGHDPYSDQIYNAASKIMRITFAKYWEYSWIELKEVNFILNFKEKDSFHINIHMSVWLAECIYRE